MIIKNVIEHFIGIQGEGKYTGTLSLFIRFFECNLFCCFCDSKYTWKTAKKDTYELDIYDLLRKNPNIKHIVFTGGEPLIQVELPKYVNKLTSHMDYIVTIETNGTIFNPDFNVYDNLLFSISPKLENSLPKENSKYRDNHFYQMLNIYEELPKFILNYKNIILKFVAENKNDFIEINKFINDINSDKKLIRKEQIYVMPQGQTKKELEKVKTNVAELCIKNGFNYSPRLHINLWDNKRGV